MTSIIICYDCEKKHNLKGVCQASNLRSLRNNGGPSCGLCGTKESGGADVLLDRLAVYMGALALSQITPGLGHQALEVFNERAKA